MNLTARRDTALLICLVLSLGLLAGPSAAAPSGPPVRIGSALSLTGPSASLAIFRKVAGEIAVEQLNRKNGLLGRPVEWTVLDDQSKPELTRSHYERLITLDKVDLVMGAFGTASILAAIPVVQRYQKLFVTDSMAMPHLSTYDMHFPGSGVGQDPARTFPTTVYEALAATGRPPKTIAIVTSKFPSVYFISVGARNLAATRGMDVVLYLEFEVGTRDFGPIAARIKDANPDFLWVGALGLDGNMLLDALKKIDYGPRGHFYLFPAPGPMLQTPAATLALAVTTFEELPPFTDNPVATEFIKVFHERAAKQKLPYPAVENQAALSYSAWQILEAAVTATKSLDDKVLARWLKTNRVDTIIGKLRFDGPTNFGDDLYRLKQVQDGRWVVVWPREWATPGTRLIYPAP